MTGLDQVQADIRLARNTRVPVLITATPDRALAVAQAIAAGGKNKTKTPLTMWDGAAIVNAARQDWRESGTPRDQVVLAVQEVQALSETEQAALMELLSAQENVGYRRIVAMSSGGLFDRVRQGTFDEALFYRLNVVHILIHSCSDSTKTSRQCCADDADDCSWGAPGDESPPSS